jgi:hypothetical protein
LANFYNHNRAEIEERKAERARRKAAEAGTES